MEHCNLVTARGKIEEVVHGTLGLLECKALYASACFVLWFIWWCEPLPEDLDTSLWRKQIRNHIVAVDLEVYIKQSAVVVFLLMISVLELLERTVRTGQCL
jgi:hypothetical protein